MPPKKRKQAPRNAFFFYMKDFQAKKEAEGFSFKGGLQEVALMASPFWKGLDPVTKRHYENMAERAKVAGTGGVRYTTQGQTYEEVDRERREAEDKKKNMTQSIIRSVQCRGREALAHTRFYFMHVNYYCQKDNGEYVPCELAVLAYSVKEGYLPQNLYHTFINPGHIPNGYSFKAKSNSEETHRTPLPPNGMGTGNYHSIYTKIMELIIENGDLEDDGRPPPFYTMNQTTAVVVNTLEGFKEHAPPSNGLKDGYFRVYSIEELFFEMKNFGLKPEGEHILINGIEDKGFPYLTNAADMLKNDLYDYAGGITCDYHEEQDVRQHCSQSYVIRWSFIFSDNLSPNLDVQMIALRHAPKGTNLNAKTITSQMSHLSVLPAAGRGRPVEGRAAPVHRSSVSVPTPAYCGSSAGSTSGRRMQNRDGPPLTIIDHGQMDDASATDHPRVGNHQALPTNNVRPRTSAWNTLPQTAAAAPQTTAWKTPPQTAAAPQTPAWKTPPQTAAAAPQASAWNTTPQASAWNTVAQQPPGNASNTDEDAPLRLPRGTGKSGAMGLCRERVPARPQDDEGEDDDYFNPTSGVGRGRGMRK